MKLVNFEKSNRKSIGVLVNDLVYDLKDSGFIFHDMQDLIKNYSLDEILKADLKIGIPLNICKLNAPIEYPNQDIICLGVNYLLHKEESKRYKDSFKQDKEYAVYFSKRANRIITNNDYIDGHFDIVDSLDYEVELAFVISKDAKDVKIEDAYDYVFGYLVLNDVSARNVQTRHHQWYFGKSFDTFTVTNEVLVTRDEIEKTNLTIKSYVNNELRQNSNTELLIYDIPHIISELSRGFTLKAGTIVSTGTPNGVGMGFTPPKFLKPGDKVTCEIEKIGSMTNIIK